MENYQEVENHSYIGIVVVSVAHLHLKCKYATRITVNNNRCECSESNSLYSYTPEVLPSAHRATGNGIAVACNRVMGLVSAAVATTADTATSAPIFICAVLYIVMVSGCIPGCKESSSLVNRPSLPQSCPSSRSESLRCSRAERQAFFTLGHHGWHSGLKRVRLDDTQ